MDFFFQGFCLAGIQIDPCQNAFHLIQICSINLLSQCERVCHSAKVNILSGQRLKSLLFVE